MHYYNKYSALPWKAGSLLIKWEDERVGADNTIIWGFF